MTKIAFGLELDSDLPEGFEYITPNETALLSTYEVLSRSFPGQDIPDLRVNIDHPNFKTTHVLVGAEGQSGAIGLGTIQQFLGYGELLNFAVLREYQGRGIGRAILHKRLEIARQDCHTIYIPPLAITNTLHEHYAELGFTTAQDGSLSIGSSAAEPVLEVYERNKDLHPDPPPQMLTLSD